MRTMLAAVAFCALAFVVSLRASAQSSASPFLTAGWHIEDEELVWVSEAPLRMGGARYEFRSKDRLLGYPAQDGGTLRLRVPRAASLPDLSVWAAGRRLDGAAGVRKRTEQRSLPFEPAISAAAADPAVAGPFRTQRLRYQRSSLRIEGYEAPVEVVGEVTAPLDVGHPVPMVLFLHGRHSTCYQGGPEGQVSGDWPCPAGWLPVPSHTGYRYIADMLASQGYLTVSIAANGINGQDGLFIDGGASARSQLVRHHLALWAKWVASGGDPWGGRFRNRVDLTEVVLVGHSRGGEGVERAAIDTAASDDWKMRGLVLIGPTAFGRQVAVGVHTTVILPFCDGDVTDLQGQQYVDIGRDLTGDRALRSSVMAMGTNHNFYNTEWTPGLSVSPAWDDWFDPGDAQCGETRSARLSSQEQQSVGLAYTAALVDLAIGEGVRSLPLLDGTRVKPASVGRATTFVHAIGGDKRLLYAAGRGTHATSGPVTASECRGYYSNGPFDLRAGCSPKHLFEVTPHWIPMSLAETAPAPRALKVEWASAGGSVQIPVVLGTRHPDAIDFRIAGEPGALPVELGVRIRNASGAWIDLGEGTMTLRSYFGPSPLGKIVARQLRASLRSANVDSRGITGVQLVPRGPRGRFWLLDVSTWQNSLAKSESIALPKVSVGDVVQREGDAGRRNVDIPIRIEGPVTRRASLWVQLTDYANFEEPTRGFWLALEPGVTSASIPFSYVADDVFNPYVQLTQVTLTARKNAVTGDFDGTVLIEEDEPAPRLTVDARRVTAGEGAALEWVFRLSAPMKNGASWVIQLQPPRGQLRELDTDDVPASFLEPYGITPPVPAVPLSQLGIFLGIEFAPGAQVAMVSIPTRQDGGREPREGVTLKLEGFGDPVVPRPIEVTGVVEEVVGRVGIEPTTY